jgi:hypothetical protein
MGNEVEQKNYFTRKVHRLGNCHSVTTEHFMHLLKRVATKD